MTKITPEQGSNLGMIHRLNAEYERLTGRDFYLYTSRPGDGQTRVTFTDGVQHSYAAGVEHMRAALDAEYERRELAALAALSRLSEGGPWQPGEREALAKTYGDWVTTDPDRTVIECGDCGDQLIEKGSGHVHLDDGSPACHSRSMANARRAWQGRPEVGR